MGSGRVPVQINAKAMRFCTPELGSIQLNKHSEENVMDWSGCAEVEQILGKVGGAWVFTGTRIPLAALYENLACGATIHEFVEWFPGVSEKQVRAVLEHEILLLKKALVS